MMDIPGHASRVRVAVRFHSHTSRRLRSIPPSPTKRQFSRL